MRWCVYELGCFLKRSKPLELKILPVKTTAILLLAPRTAQELVGGDQRMLVNGLKPAIVYRRDQFNWLQHTYRYT